MSLQEKSYKIVYGSRIGEQINRTSVGRFFQRGLISGLARMTPNKQKVLCIGWLKTGTSSFGCAMRRLGYWHYGYDDDIFSKWFKREGDVERILRFAGPFDSFDDLPWNRLEVIKAFVERYPETKCVLLEREPESWLGSLQRFREVRGRESSKEPDDELQYYVSRNEELRKIVDPRNMLVMNVVKGDGYDKLCPFLGLPVVKESFPKRNVNKSIREGTKRW